jgi:GTPase
MLPVIAIVGRPNVGKSTLFNAFTKSRNAIVADMPGVTRDRQYGHATYDDKPLIVIDTGGVGEALPQDIDQLMAGQSWQATEEADVILFLVDAKAGLTPADTEIAGRLRQLKKPLILVVNKTDGLDESIAMADFYQIGFANVVCIAASHRRGTSSLLAEAASLLPEPDVASEAPEKGVKIAVIGKPNVGKSTLVNRLLGEERVVVCDHPGTTRDSIFIPYTRRDKPYTLIDTAGVRRRKNIKEAVEKFSIIKALQAVESANVVVFLIDARENITEQDLKLLGYVLQAGRALVIAVNKWDNLSIETKDRIHSELDRRLVFIDYARIQFISAKHGTGVGDLYQYIDEAYSAAFREIKTPEVNRVLSEAIKQHQPPMKNGRRIKIRYAHIGGHNPPIIVLHGNQLTKLPDAYRRYLTKTFREAFNMMGTPIRLELRTTDNPYNK